MVLPDVQNFRHMSRMLDSPRYQDSGRRMVAGLRCPPCAAPLPGPLGAFSGVAPIRSSRRVDARHRKGL
jgi:hypothetical protein